MRWPTGKGWIGIAVGGALLALVVWSLWPAPVAVDVGQATRDALRVTLEEEGETRVRDRYTISAPVAGRVRRIDLEPGDPVRAGETVLAVFEPGDASLLDPRARREAEAAVRSARAALAEAEAGRERARAEHDYAANEVRRIRRLAEEGVASGEQLDRAERDARTTREALVAAESSVAAARSELERARAALTEGGGGDGKTMEIRSPIDGVVLQRMQESSAIVQAGAPLLEVGDPAELEIVADFLSTDAVRIRAGNRVDIVRWGGERTLSGRVRRVEPFGFTKISALGVEEQRVNVIVDFDDPREAWDALGDGYRVEVAVVVWSGEDVLQVPSSSLVGDGERGDGGRGWAVFRLVDGRASKTAVEVGHRTGRAAEILSGLDEGDVVIVHPQDAVADDVRVEPRSGNS